MGYSLLKYAAIAAIAASMPVAFADSDELEGINPRPNWKDSYSIDGKCYCDTTYDHNIGGIMVDGPDGRITVREACDLVGDGPGPEEDRVYYNDIQCGNGPANDQLDEQVCPGRVDMGKAGCKVSGPKWHFPGTDPTPPPPPSPKADADPAPAPKPEDAPAPSPDAEAKFVEEELGSSNVILTGLSVTDKSNGSTTPCGNTIVKDDYPEGFGLRAEVSDYEDIESVKFSTLDGYTRTEKVYTYDMFGSTGKWEDPPNGVVVVNVEVTMKDGSTEVLEVDIDLE